MPRLLGLRQGKRQVSRCFLFFKKEFELGRGHTTPVFDPEVKKPSFLIAGVRASSPKKRGQPVPHSTKNRKKGAATYSVTGSACGEKIKRACPQPKQGVEFLFASFRFRQTNLPGLEQRQEGGLKGASLLSHKRGKEGSLSFCSPPCSLRGFDIQKVGIVRPASACLNIGGKGPLYFSTPLV